MELSQFKYDVFLSFRGEDTRNNFTSHLHRALCNQKIEAFIDYELRRGDEISLSLLKAIEESQISVIIFSKGYASSRWCLEELTKILRCKNKYGQIIIPVFHEVDPSDVRNQTGSFAEAFAEHEQHFKESLDRVQTWKDALKDAASLSGFDSRVIKPDSLLIENIVQDVLKRLNHMSSDDNNGLIGIDSRINEIESLLRIRSEDVHSIGICGAGGIGKTVLAGAIFDKISSQFEVSCFIHNVREESEQNGGLNRLRRELCFTMLGDVNVNMSFSFVGRTFTKKRLSHKKILVVFDDVTDFRQIEYLIGGFDCLGSGSKIIITTRNKQVLKNCRVDHIYEVKELPLDDAFKLFCRYAFRQNSPTLEYEKLSHQIVNCLGGIPLALKVFGSSLLDEGKEVWESAMKKLEKVLAKGIYDVLKISYDGLDDNEKKIFLDIACFLKGKDTDLVKQFLNACGFFTDVGISGLVNKSLIAISTNNTITMHDLLQAMGREIVQQQSIEDLGQRTRLWHHEDIYQVLTKNMGSKAIQGISFDMSKTKYIDLNPCAFTNMRSMRFLEFYCSDWNNRKNKVYVSEGHDYVLNELRYLHWYGCPFKSLHSNFCLQHLVVLRMRDSNVEQLWNGVLQLVNLKEIDLGGSKHLISCPDLSGARNLEMLILDGCTNLLEIPSSIQYLSKLDCLDLFECKSLGGLPDCLAGLKSLKTLNTFGCSRLKMLPTMPCNIEYMNLSETAIEELSPAIDNLSKLVELNLRKCSRLKSLPSSICKIRTLESLKMLCVAGTAIPEVPLSIPEESRSINAVICMLLGLAPFLSVPYTIAEDRRFYVSSLDCFKSYQNGLKETVEDVLKTILSLATSGAKRPGLKHQPTASICFPGSEIPEWFSFQSTGSLMTKELPPGWNNNNFLGFALCAIIEIQHHAIKNSWDFLACCYCNLKSEDGQRHKFRGIFGYQLPYCYRNGCQYVESDHVYMGYDHLMYPKDIGDLCYNNEVTFEFYLHSAKRRIKYCKVKSCGVRLMYRQDVGKSCGSLSFGEREDEPQPKRLKSIKLL